MVDETVGIEVAIDNEGYADAVGLLRDQHDYLVGMVMGVIDLVDGVQAEGHAVNCQGFREAFAPKLRASIAATYLALEALGEREAHVVCWKCGERADLMAEHPLEDWNLGRLDVVGTCMLCPDCKDIEVVA